MLSWSSTESGTPADITAIAVGGPDAGLPHATALIEFTDAAADTNNPKLVRARTELVRSAGEAFMVDAAAVIANFEMMTRVADGTGARFSDRGAEQRAEIGERLRINDFMSAR